MNLKRLFFWAVIFSLLLGYVLLTQKESPEKNPLGNKTKPAKVFSFSPEKMDIVEMIQKNKKVVLKKTSSIWKIDYPEPKQEIRQEAVTSVISAIIDTINIDTIKNNPENPAQFGLSSPSTILNIFLEDEKEPIVFLLGAKTPTTISMYAMLKHNNTVIEIGTFLNSSINSFMVNF